MSVYFCKIFAIFFRKRTNEKKSNFRRNVFSFSPETPPRTLPCLDIDLLVHCLVGALPLGHCLAHPRLTKVRIIRFLLFKIIRVLVYNETIFKLTDLFVSYLSVKKYMPAKKYLRKKANKLCFIEQIVIESHSFLEY